MLNYHDLHLKSITRKKTFTLLTTAKRWGQVLKYQFLYEKKSYDKDDFKN